MLKTFFSILCAVILSFSISALQDDGPVARLTNDYDRTHDLSIAYHLARITFALKQYDETQGWLSLLKERGWKMGIDQDDFPQADMPVGVQQLVQGLSANQMGQTRAGALSSIRITDPHFIPENIAYDPESGILYAGSLAKPRIMRVHVNEAFENDEMPLPASVAWGVIYGMKYHAERRELWVLHNRTNSDGMHGALTVLDRIGREIKTYKTPGQQPVELNDLCFSRGNVYLTDSRASKIYAGEITGDTLALYYENSDIKYPNGIACNDDTGSLFVADFRGVNVLNMVKPDGHVRLRGAQGVSLGGVDGLYLNGDTLIGVQNYLGTPKIVTTNIANTPMADQTRVFDVGRPEFRIPTTGFMFGSCLYYIANSSLDALMPDGSINPDGPAPKPAQIIALNVSPMSDNCLLITRSVAAAL